MWPWNLQILKSSEFVFQKYQLLTVNYDEKEIVAREQKGCYSSEVMHPNKYSLPKKRKSF